MSCSSPPLGEHRHPHDDDGRTRAPALDLLDEYWFFSNTLATNNNNSAKKKTTTTPLLPRSPSTSTAIGEKASSGSAGPPPSRLRGRRLLRTPSLPSSRVVGMTMESPLPLPTNKDDDDLVHQGGAAAGAASANQQQAPQQQQRVAAEEHEIDDDDLNWSSIYQGVLRTRMAEGGGRSRSSSALRRAPSMPMPSSGDGDGDGHGRRQTMSTPSMPSNRMLRHSHSTLGRHTPPIMPKQAEAEQRTPGGGGGGQPRREVRSSSTMRLSASQHQQQQASKKQTTSGLQLQDKKWKSSSDLESIEVQGFRDLGFVFDREEQRDSLAQVLPGLKQDQQQTKSSSTSQRRPYLSEAWQPAVRRPALARVQSAAEMKDQLRMWAQAVACNVRQEC